MAYIPPHKRHSKGLQPTPAPETDVLPSFRKKVNLNSFGGDQQKRKEKNFHRKSVVYTDDAVVKWFTVGLADQSPFSSLLRLHHVSLQSFEQKSRQKPLSLLLPEGCSEGTNELIDKPWLFVAENVKQDLFLSFQHMKREMEETDMAEVKPSVVARFGKVLFYGNSSICQESLKTNPLSETTLREMKRFFHTDVPPAYMDYMENQVAEKLGLEYVQGKELYCVKLSDELRPESTVSCKCTVAKDHKKIQLYKIELNRVRHMVADMSCLGKSSDLRLILYTKKIKMALSDEEINEIKDLIGSAILDSDVEGGLRWPSGKDSLGGRYVVTSIGHTTAKSYRNSSVRFKFRHADRFDFRSSIGEVSPEIFLKMPGIISQLRRGMYAACMWIVQLLLILSKEDSVFIYTPEYYLETLVDCFHVLRKSDPPFVPATIFLKQGLTSFVTFAVTHFNDPRISSAEMRDLLLQSISVLVQYKEFLATFECNETATQRMPKALLSAFDNRSWIPVTNILLRLCKGSGFGSSKRGESSSSSSVIYQKLLREVCCHDEELFSTFLNRLFNTLSWAMTEFSVSIREMQETYKVLEFQQRKCSVIFDLSCNLARVLEFCTHEIPQAFLSGADTNLRRLTEVIVFILNHLISAADPDLLDLFLRRPGQSPEKVSKGMILAPLAGIILNLIDASRESETGQNDMVGIFASMDCPDTVVSGFQYLLEYNWASLFRGDDYLKKIRQLEKFSSMLICRSEVVELERIGYGDETDYDDSICCICFACQANAQFVPCSHVSCFGCISRHLLNCERCFFCNASVLEVLRTDVNAD